MQNFTLRLEQQAPQREDVVRASQHSHRAQLGGCEDIQDEQGLEGLCSCQKGSHHPKNEKGT